MAPPTVKGRIPGLDGLRAVSILLVLAAHALGTKHLPYWPRSHMLGDAGVRTFFVISGFLITTLLLRERAKTGGISLAGFYVRRVFRIFPAFYTYLGVIAILVAIGWIAVPTRDLIFAATYTMNFHADRAWWVGHLWSLAVEEQFYLLWPAALVALGNRGALIFALVAIAIAPALRLGTLHYWPAQIGLIDQAFPFVFDAIATGCVLAMIRDRLEANRLYMRFLASPAFVIVPIAALGFLSVSGLDFNFGPGFTVGNVLIAVTIHRCVRFPDLLATRLLERQPLVWIGGLSYSLYLWQQIFINRHADEWFNAFPANIACAFAVATCSYYLVEQPILSWRARRAARHDSRK
jgi:peptidoglycan/LPS O-acetylase OafA/YrhL